MRLLDISGRIQERSGSGQGGVGEGSGSAQGGVEEITSQRSGDQETTRSGDLPPQNVVRQSVVLTSGHRSQ